MKLADYLYENSMSPAWLRRALGIKHRSTVWRWLIGDRIPNRKTIARIEKLTNGQVTLEDFLDPSPPKCLKVITDEHGHDKAVLPWSPEADRARAEGHDDPDSVVPPPIQRALETLGSRAWYAGKGKVFVDGRLSDFRGIVRKANEVLQARGRPTIKYPGVDPIHD